MPRDLASVSRAVLSQIALLGYRTGVGVDDHDGWIATAKRDSDGDFHRSYAPSEDEVVAAMAE